MSPSTSLRAITHRLTTTPVKELPHIVSFLAASLSDCGDILTASGQKNTNSETSDALQVHKLKARLTSLLQDRSFDGRWTAVVLVKATVEVGQQELLHECEPWVRGLIGILSRPDPISTKKLTIITLTRIFHLTHQYQTLTREITTPSLPAFITASLNLISVKSTSEPHRKLKQNSPLLETVLHAFNDLIARHPTIFRPFSAQLHSLLMPILGSSTMPGCLHERVVHLCQQLFISLHNCAPKNLSGEEWSNACKITIASIHQTADHAFRAVIEQWESTDSHFRNTAISGDSSQVVGDDGPDPLGLPGWQGIHAGVGRLMTLLCLLSGFMSTRTASTVSLPVGAILDLTARLTSVVVPWDGDGDSIPTNPEISREEREDLWIELPRIHVACLDLFSNMIISLQTGAIPFAQNILEQALWLFRAERSFGGIRASFYHLISFLLPLVGSSMTEANLSTLTTIIRSCCHDLLPSGDNGAPQTHCHTETKNRSKGNQGSTSIDAFLNPALKGGNRSKAVVFAGLQAAALKLLPVLFMTLPIEHIPLPVRVELDRTAILIANQSAMVASVLNPVPLTKGRKAIPSILPFLSRKFFKEFEVECLLRPRMPVLGTAFGAAGFSQEEEEDEDEQYAEMRVKSSSATRFFEGSMPSSLSTQEASSTEPTQEAVHSKGKRSLPGDVDTGNLKNLSNLVRDASQDIPQTKRTRLPSDNILSGAGQPLVFNSEAATSPNELVVASLSEHQTVSMTLSETTASPAATPSASAPSFPSASTTGVSIAASIATKMDSSDVQRINETSGEEGDEGESDDEIPTLNIEPDTDEEDEDDISMEG